VAGPREAGWQGAGPREGRMAGLPPGAPGAQSASGETVPLKALPLKAQPLKAGPAEALPLGGVPPGAGTLRAAAEYLACQHRHLRHC
jgi:hypothetical protein